jgi:hypothetical protein
VAFLDDVVADLFHGWADQFPSQPIEEFKRLAFALYSRIFRTSRRVSPALFLREGCIQLSS